MDARQETLREHARNYPAGAIIFLPASGNCLSCGFDIIEHFGHEAMRKGKIVTGCPKCHRSFCD